MSTPSITRFLSAVDGGGRVRIPMSRTKAWATPWGAFRLARQDGLVISREGLTEVRGGKPRRNLPWDDIEHVGTSRHRVLPGKHVTYSVVPEAREWADRSGVPAAHHSHAPKHPGTQQPSEEYWMNSGYQLGPDQLATLLESARRRYSTHPG